MTRRTSVPAAACHILCNTPIGLPIEKPLEIAGARFLQARCPSCHPTNNVKALKEQP